ncbi:MAG: hypothetical protein FD153_1737 [Rhodospirillaceae bacterium]|nr:MAG: hypothetical protein FD153_1737 [Rhodospirillaceae bacterium]
MRRSYGQTVGGRQERLHGTVLLCKRRDEDLAISRMDPARAQIVFAPVVGWHIAGQYSRSLFKTRFGR